jgi:hypothetical protein
MKRALFAVGLAAFCVSWGTSARAGTLKCAADSVKVGNVCVDKYEASVWQIAPSNTGLVNLVRKARRRSRTSRAAGRRNWHRPARARSRAARGVGGPASDFRTL